MMKLSLSISRALLLGALVILPTAVSAQDDKKAEFERQWYDTCYTKKDMAKCYEQSKELLAKYADSTYKPNAVKVVDNKEINDLWEQFNAVLRDYYAGAPDAAKLDKLFNAGDAFLQRKPGYPYVIAQQALAGTGAAVIEVCKDRAKVKGYVEKAMSLFAAANTTDANSIKQEEWLNYRDSITAAGQEFMGYDVKESKGDAKAAIDHFTKSTQVKNPSISGIGGWKDPNNYYFRSALINDDYVALSKQYAALPDDQKTGDAGKEVLKQLNVVVDKLLAEYSRLIAVATQSTYKSYQDFAKETFDSLWKYRTDAPEKGAAYLQSYVADPTIVDIAVPAKAETAAPPTGIPTAGAGPVKVTGGGQGQMPGANGTKAATPKAKPAPKGKRRKR